MRTRTVAFIALALVIAFVGCQKSETAQTETSSTVTTETTSTAPTDTMSTGTTTVQTTETAVSSSGAEKIQEGAKQIGEGLKEEARKAAAATGEAMQRGGAELERRAEEAKPQPATPPPAPAPAASTSSGNVANGSGIFSSKCVACHGADASGNTAMGRKNNIPDLRSASVQGLSDAQLANVIANGKPGGLSASAHKSKALSAPQIQDVIAYLRSLRR